MARLRPVHLDKEWTCVLSICQAPGLLQGARLGVPRMLASAPVSVWLQPLARGCGPGGQVAFAHAASLTLWSQVKMEVGWLVPDAPEQALAAMPMALLGSLAFRPSRPSYFYFPSPSTSFSSSVIQVFGDLTSGL